MSKAAYFAALKTDFLKFILMLLIDTFTIERVNDRLAEIYCDKAIHEDDDFYDEVSAKYDDINKMMKG